MIDIKLIKHIDPGQTVAPSKYTAIAKSRGKYTFNMMADDISHSCSLTRADVAGCMEALIEKTVQHILDGYTVDFRGLGSFMLRVDSRLATPEEVEASGFRVGSIIKGFCLRFIPAVDIRRKISTAVETRVISKDID